MNGLATRQPTITWASFLYLARSKLRLCSANHTPGFWSNLPCDYPSTAWLNSEQETENGPWTSVDQDLERNMASLGHVCDTYHVATTLPISAWLYPLPMYSFCFVRKCLIQLWKETFPYPFIYLWEMTTFQTFLQSVGVVEGYYQSWYGNV